MLFQICSSVLIMKYYLHTLWSPFVHRLGLGRWLLKNDFQQMRKRISSTCSTELLVTLKLSEIQTTGFFWLLCFSEGHYIALKLFQGILSNSHILQQCKLIIVRQDTGEITEKRGISEEQSQSRIKLSRCLSGTGWSIPVSSFCSSFYSSILT